MKKALIIILAVLSAWAFTGCNNSKKALEAVIEEANQELPEYVGEGLTMEKMKLIGDNVVIPCTVNEDEIWYSVEDLDDPDIIENMKAEMIKEYRYPTDEDTKEMFDLIKAAKCNITILYTSKQSGYEIKIPISYKEIE